MLQRSPFQSDQQAWQVPDDVADLLPGDALQLEHLRAEFLKRCQSWGYALVVPPLLGYLPSLLSGAGERLHMQTFRLVDLHSGLALGVRADTTPQVARVDAHLLQHSGITRLCYVGPVLHTRAEKPHGTREPLQFGAEMYGHGGIEGDAEVMELALQCLQLAPLPALQIDVAHVGVVQALVQDLHLPAAALHELHALLAAKDRAGLTQLCAQLPDVHASCAAHLIDLCECYGPATGEVGVLARARAQLPHSLLMTQALNALEQIVQHLHSRCPEVKLSLDLADLQGYGYYTGLRFAIYTAGAADSIARGGRYDAIGAVFGRQRPAVGFSLDLKALLSQQTNASTASRAAIAAPWLAATKAQTATQAALHTKMQAALQAKVAQLRATAQTVIFLSQPDWEQVALGQTLPGFLLSHKLVWQANAWRVQELQAV